MVIDQFPDRAIVDPTQAVDGDITLVYGVAIRIKGIGHRFRKVGPSDIFGACEEAIVVKAVKIEALVQSYLAVRRHHTYAKLRVLLISAAFLPLAKAVRVKVINRIGYTP